jgi:glycosyltransferase involved in cell wall biosynthesis
MADSLLFSLIIPTFNEAANILPMVNQVHTVLASLPHEIIVIDDDSPDGTAFIAEQRQKNNPWLHVIRRTQEKGLSSAVLAGFESAQGSILGVMDADRSHDETVLPKLIEAVQQGADLAVGSRRIPGGGAVEWPWYRRLTSTIATAMAKGILRLPLSDPMSGFFVLRREVYESCKHRLSPRGYKILVEIAFKGRPGRIAEFPFIFKNRKEGYSKLTGFVVWEYLRMLFTLGLDHAAQRLRHRYHTGRYQKVAQRLQPGRLLDIGCGRPCETMPDGAFLRFVGRGVGVDIKPCEGDFEFVQGSLLALPFPDASFENVVAMEVLEHVTDPDKAFSEISRVLKAGGRLMVTVPHENWLWKIIWHLWEHSFGYMWHETHTGTRDQAEWLALMKRYFKMERRRRHWYFDLVFQLSKP